MIRKTGIMTEIFSFAIIEIKYILKYILDCNKISQYCISDQINAGLVSIRDPFQKHLKKSPIFERWCI